MQISWLALAAVLVATPFAANGQSAEALVDSKRKADMTYAELMALMGSAMSMIQQGILAQNKELVRTGADIIGHHPAPSHKPWTIVPEADRETFKETLLSYDKILHGDASRVEQAAGARDWLGAADAAHDLTRACVTCHLAWKARVQPPAP